MKINTNLINYKDTCYIPKNNVTKYYGYSNVSYVSPDAIQLEAETGDSLFISAKKLYEMKVDFVHKELWIRDNKAYFIENEENDDLEKA